MNTRTFILLLAQQEPLSFVSGQSVTLSKVLQAYNRNEFHHLMPRAYLKGLDRETWEINALVNFAIIAASDNKTLGGVAPSEYKRHIPAAKLQLILDRSLCPDALFTDDFDQFGRGPLVSAIGGSEGPYSLMTEPLPSPVTSSRRAAVVSETVV